MRLRKLIAVLVALLMVVSMMPLSVLAEMGGDFSWTEEDQPMLIEQILERDGFIDGIWFPWLDGGRCGHNLTGNDLMAQYYNEPQSTAKFVDWNSVELDRLGADTIYRQIYNLKVMGYNIMAYAGSIYSEGVIYDANGDVTGIKQEYLDNARRLLNMCREIGMPVMWNVYFHSSTIAEYYGIDGWKVMNQMLGNPDIADHYADRFVRPLCQMLAEYPDVVALVSIADEPENEINDAGIGDHFGNDRGMYGVNRDDMVYFMQGINRVVREELPNVARTVASNNGNKSIYRDFDLDLMGHNEYTDGCTSWSVESFITDADPILTEYNIGGNTFYNDDDYADKLIAFREWMMANGYKGGFQWCWLPDGAPMPNKEGTAYYLLRNGQDSTSFRKTVTLLKHYMDEYRAEHRGENITLDAPVLYANAADGRVLFIPSKRATKITIQRSNDGGNTWETILYNAVQEHYVDDYQIGTYTDDDAPESGYCYRIIAGDDNGNTVISEANNVAGSEKRYNKDYVAPTFQLGEYYVRPTQSEDSAKLTSFAVEKNRPYAKEQNLIINSSFESTGGQWNNSNFLQYASVVSDTATPDGSKSLYFDTSAQSEGAWYTFTVDGLKENTEYTFSAWMKGAYLSDDNQGMASIGVMDPDSDTFMVYWRFYKNFQRASRDTQQLYPTAWDNEWHLRSVKFNSGNMTEVTIALYGYNSQMWVDDIALFESANGMKYDSGENSKAVTSTEYNPAGGATNAVTDPNVDNPTYWNTGAGYKQGFMSIANGALQYTASSDPKGVRYIKWIDVKPGTDYYVSYTVNVTTAGGGRVAILDDAMLLPFENMTQSFSSTGQKTVTGRISTGKYDQLGLCVVDLGGVATIDNVCLYEGGESVVIPTTPSFDGFITNGDFEVGSSTGWENLWNNNTVELVDGRDSLFALKGTAGGNYTQVRQKIAVEKNTDYVIEVWAKNVNGTTLIVKDSTDANLKQTGLQGSGSTWTKTILEFNSGDHEFIYLGFMGASAGSTWTIDDVKMYEKVTESNDGYLVNGDFETGISNPWENVWGSNTVTIVDGHDSSYGMKVNAGQYTVVRETVTVEQNTTYVIEAWVKDSVNAVLLVKNSADSVNIVNKALPGGSAWTKVIAEFNSGDNEFVYVGFMGAAAGATYTVDDVKMYVKEISAGLQNGGFENGDANWNFNQGSHAIVPDAHSGNYALQLTDLNQWDEAAVQTFDVDSYSYYTITWWYKAAPGTGIFNLLMLDGISLANASVFQGKNYMQYYSGDWQQGSYTVYTDVSTSLMLKLTTQGSDPGTILIDDITVEKTDCPHRYSASCDTDCDACGAERYVDPSWHDYYQYTSRTPTCGDDGWKTYICRYCNDSYTETIPATGAHTYDNACDAFCNICGAIRTAPHDYSGACDAYCDMCGHVRQAEEEHEYEEWWREEPTCGYDGYVEYGCRKCGDWYDEPLPATGQHEYSGDCDAYCNGCDLYRVAEAHTYDNVCDAYCNVCWEYRYVPGHQTDTFPCMDGYCIRCGVWMPAVYDHDYAAACDIDCDMCGTQRVPSAEHYVVAGYPCKSGQCDNCGADVPATEEHTFPYACTETCAVCGADNEDVVEHQSDALGCENGHCTMCGMLMPAIGHQYSASCDTSCNVCGHVRSGTAITNGGFENGEEDWQFNTGIHALVSDAHSGDYALQLTDPAIWGEAAVQIVDVEPNTQYTVTWWSKAEYGTGTYNLFLMNATDFSNLELDKDNNKNWMNGHTGQWRMHRVVMSTGTATSILVKFSTESYSPGTILIDDILIEGYTVADHTYESVETAPDCVNGGYTTYTCTACGDSYVDNHTEPLEHEWIDADCTTAKTCGACGATEGEALGHSYQHEYDTDCDICAAIREIALPIVFGGNSTAESVSGLAFRFDLPVIDMQANTSTAIYDTATLDGYHLLGMGAVATNGAATITVPCVYLYDWGSDSCSFVIRIINIPTAQYDTVITVVPYVTLDIDGVATTFYGDEYSATYNGVDG